MKVAAYSLKGTKLEDAALPKEFAQKPNLKLLAQAVYVYQERGHVGLRNTKTRSEVNRTTKKVYNQKGTGGARHGSRRANLFVGGGIVFGPRTIRRIISLSNAMKSKARVQAFSLKANEKEIVVGSGISKINKTKEAASFIEKLKKDTKAKRFTFVLSEKSRSAFKFLRNLGSARTIYYKDINALDIVIGGTLIMDASIFDKK